MVVKTWPRGVDRLFAYREFEISDASGVILAKATSTWIVIDRLERRAVKPSIVESILPYVDKRMVLDRNARRLAANGERALVGTHEVVFSDLDTNGHVNNCKYLEWVIDFMDHQWLNNLHKCCISLNFVSELMFHDGVDIFRCEDKDALIFEGVSHSAAKCVFVICVEKRD